MELKAISRYLRFFAVACLAVYGLAASEHHGLVKFGSIPVPGATVTATKDDKKMVAVTDETGAYNFPDLEDGVWKIQVEMLCFTTITKEIGIAANAPAAEWELKMMSMDEIKPSIQAPAPPSTAPTAPATAAGATAPGAPAQPAAPQTAAVTPAKPAKGKKGTPAPTTPQAGFQRTEVNAASPDSGAASASAPSIASPAEAQTASDAFVVNGSGSNGIERRAIGNGRKGARSLYNGGIDFRFDNDVLDARNYSTTGQETPRTPFNHFTVGGAVQGPLLIPHLFRWTGNFYLQYATSRNRNASTSPATLPTAAERAGDFSQVTDALHAPITVTDPSTGQPFPNNLIPASQISPQAKYLLNFYPLPQFTAAGQSYNYQVPIISRTSFDQVQARVNKQIPNKTRDSLNTGFTYTNSRNENPNIFSFLDTTGTVNVAVNAQYNHTFSRQLFGRISANYSRSSIRVTPFFANTQNVSGLAGITGNDQAPGDWGPPNLSFSNFQGLSDVEESFTRNQTMAFSTTLTYIRRPHQFQFGADYRIQDFNQLSQSNGRGTFGFNGATTGFDFASFLLGVPDTAMIAFGNADKYLKTSTYDAWILDDWRATPSISFNFGLRWDYSTPVTEKYGRLVGLDITPGFTASAPVIASDPTGSLSGMRYPSSLINPDKHEVSPRVSLAWKPIFGSSMVVRGGYGVYYNSSVYLSIANGMTQQSPLSKSLNVANSLTTPLTLANGFIASPNITTNNFAVDPNYRVGYSQNWYVSVQQNVTASMVLTAQYSGVKGTRAAQEFLPNTYPIGATNPCPSCLPGYTYLASNGNSTKHAGQLNVRRRFHGGLATTFTYTYSKAIDDVGGLGSALGGPVAQNWLNLAGERGLSSFDQRHLFTAQFQYSTGVGVRGGALLGGWRGVILKGWTFTSNINLGSGLPFTPNYYINIVSGIQGTVRPEYIGGDPNATNGGRFLNAGAYAAPPAGQWGNAGRDSITGPNQFSMIASMQRSFADNKISVRFDSTNVLNHPTYSSWNTTFNPKLADGGQFGIVNPPGGMRTLVATLRWTF